MPGRNVAKPWSRGRNVVKRWPNGEKRGKVGFHGRNVEKQCPKGENVGKPCSHGRNGEKPSVTVKTTETWDRAGVGKISTFYAALNQCTIFVLSNLPSFIDQKEAVALIIHKSEHEYPSVFLLLLYIIVLAARMSCSITSIKRKSGVPNMHPMDQISTPVE